MRSGAGIILIILGVWELVSWTIGFIHFGSAFYLVPASLLGVAVDVFLVAGGVLCLTRKYWGLCLASALLALFIGISSIATPALAIGHAIVTWDIVLRVIGLAISTILISVTKKEWQEVQG
jgi:hypothetical protein